MIKNKFKNSLKRGTGEAILILKNNPELDFSDLIIEASINNLAYDPQCEGSREEYLYELIQLSPNIEKIEQELLKKLSESKDDNWGVYQLFKIAKLFAQKGNKYARKSIYERYSKSLEPDYEFINTLVPIELDGYDGFKFIAEIKGQQFIQDLDAWEDDYIFQYSKELYPEIDFEKKLEEEAGRNKFIKAFLKEIKRSRNQRKSYKRKEYTYKSILELIERNERVFSVMGKRLNAKDLIKLANNLKIEKNEQKIIKYLNIFSFIKYPLEWETLYNLLDLENKEIRNQVIRGLSFFKAKEIRDLAITNLNIKNFDEDYLNLLVENYNEGDYKLINNVLKNTRNIHKFHDFCLLVLNIYEKNKTKECIEPLKKIYDKGFCGLCRINVVEIMIEMKILPEYIKQEGIFDSKMEIRELIKNCT